jgi:hypothetical protein
MAERHPGWVTGIDASEARLATGLLTSSSAGAGDQLDPLRTRSGLRDGTGNPGMVTMGTGKVTVNPFQAVIVDASRPAAGPYLVTLDAAKDIPIEAADETNSRIDLVAVTVDPAVDPGFTVRVVTGTRAPTPQPPAVGVPTYLLLAQVTVPAAGRGLPSVADRRQFTAALGGILPAFGAADLPAVAPIGAFAYRLDTGTLLVRKSSGWVTYSPPGGSVDTWQRAALVNGWSNYQEPSFVPASYTRTGDGWVRLQGLVSGGDITKTVFTLPPGYRPVANHVFSVKVGLGTVGALNVLTDGRVAPGNAADGELSAVWTSLDGVAFATY